MSAPARASDADTPRAHAAREGRLSESVARDAAAMIYAQSPMGIAMSAAAAAAMVLAIDEFQPRTAFLQWLGCFLAIALGRIWDTVRWYRTRALPGRDGNRDIRRAALWVTLIALGWAAFPVLFFHDLDAAGRSLMIIVYSAFVGGSVAILSIVGKLAIVYAALMILPVAAMFMMEGTPAGYMMGGMALAYFAMMCSTARTTQRATLGVIRLGRTNEMLMREAVRGRRRTEALNRRLADAKRALKDANRSLETRVRQRTDELEKEVRERNEVAQRLSELASSDPMTGLANRARLEQALNRMLIESGRSERGLAVLFIDLDRFKDVNDALGHLAGDSVLRTVARRLGAHMPSDALLARWGGDEFVVAMPSDRGVEAIIDFALELRALTAEPIPLQQEIVRIDASVGVAIYPLDGSDAETLVRSADMAVYAAKVSGRASVRRFEESMYARLRERHALGQALREAIDADRLQLAYQPILSIDGDRVESFEALTRWRDPERGWVSPQEFIPVAEESGSIVALGRWVLESACRAAARWPGPDAPAVAVNISAAQVLSGDFVDVVDTTLKSSGLPPDRLELELTESFFAQDAKQMNAVLAEVRARGVRIAVDDFGTGYSTLSLLRHLPVDVIKIDRSFVADATAFNATFIEAIRTIARGLDLRLTAEGVETDEQHQMLARLGVDLVQGYLFARPMPEADAARWLARRRARDDAPAEAADMGLAAQEG
jgi:diguanylate cyclase (GGDEF)-like protein